MICPTCAEDTAVVDSRECEDGTRRRRKCKWCGERFTTYEFEASFLDYRRLRATEVYRVPALQAQQRVRDLEFVVQGLLRELSAAGRPPSPSLRELAMSLITTATEESSP